MKKLLNSALIAWALTMWIPEKSKATDIVEWNKVEVNNILESNWIIIEDPSQINTIITNWLNDLSHKYNLSDNDKDLIKEVVNNKEFQNKLFDALHNNENWTYNNIILSLFLWLLYAFAYISTIKKIKTDYMPIDIKSFAIFWWASWGMAWINGLAPWSLVYTESCLLAFTSVWLHIYNRQQWNEYKKEENQTKKINDFKEIFDNFPSRVVKYNLDWYPEIWNKKMAEETWYTHEEVIAYWEEHWTVMTLTYTWENLERVKLYLESINKTWIWYQNVSFTMTTKSWEEKTFLWNTMPYEWWTIRVGNLLTDVEQIKKELSRTMEEIKKDYMTWAYNKKAFEDDFHKLLTSTLRKHDPKKYTICLIDLDDFKNVNDKYSHEVGDMILKKFTSHIMGAIRWTDKLYRIWWDEFILFLDSDLKDQINVHNKLNKLRQSFYEHEFTTEKWILKVWSSWGTKLLDVMEYYDENLKIEDSNKILWVIKNDIDKYMYWVKYYKLIKNKLIKDWRIQENWEEKNAIAEAIYNGANNLLWVLIIWQNWSFSLSIDELKEIDTIKMNIDNLRS